MASDKGSVRVMQMCGIVDWNGKTFGFRFRWTLVIVAAVFVVCLSLPPFFAPSSSSFASLTSTHSAFSSRRDFVQFPLLVEPFSPSRACLFISPHPPHSFRWIPALHAPYSFSIYNSLTAFFPLFRNNSAVAIHTPPFLPATPPVSLPWTTHRQPSQASTPPTHLTST